MKKTLGVSAFLLASAASLTASAAVEITWSAAYSYDTGDDPAAAAGHAGGIDVGIEVHQGDSGSLWFRVATPQGYLTPPASWTSFLNWRPASTRYDTGFRPSITASNEKIVEVHEGGDGRLWFHTGTFSVGSGGATATFSSGGTFNWNTYDNGFKPSIAAYGTQIVEVHEDGAGGLWFHTGTLASDGTVHFAPSGNAGTWSFYDNGHRPSVAMRGSTIVEAHEGNGGQLFVKVGTIHTDGTVSWGAAQFYDNGFKPSVTLSPTFTLVEAHEGGDGTLWSRMGNVGGTIAWQSVTHYDNGFKPALACFPTPNYDSGQFVGESGPTLGFEVHQAASGETPGAEWYRVFNLWDWSF